MTTSYTRIFSIAPMMDWTDRHCRYFHRLLSQRALLFTEMVTSAAIVHGDREKLLAYDQSEHPIALQLGGSDPQQLAEAAIIATQYQYDEINLNVGCPSDRVKSGHFGACLMATPDLVAECVSAMKKATHLPVTVKCRIGIDDQDSEKDLNIFVDALVQSGVDALYVHARKAWLQGLSPKENRDIPPLDYERVHRLKGRLPELPIMINGGLISLADCQPHLQILDGVMLGRAAYHNPRILMQVDPEIFGEDAHAPTFPAICDQMCHYAEAHLSAGGRLNQITRHMLGLAAGLPGARQFRQILSTQAVQPMAGPEIIVQAFAAVDFSTPQALQVAS